MNSVWPDCPLIRRRQCDTNVTRHSRLPLWIRQISEYLCVTPDRVSDEIVFYYFKHIFGGTCYCKLMYVRLYRLNIARKCRFAISKHRCFLLSDCHIGSESRQIRSLDSWQYYSFQSHQSRRSWVHSRLKPLVRYRRFCFQSWDMTIVSVYMYLAACCNEHAFLLVAL